MSRFYFVVAYDSQTREWEQAPTRLDNTVYDGAVFRDPKEPELEFVDMLNRVVDKTLAQMPTP